MNQADQMENEQNQHPEQLEVEPLKIEVNKYKSFKYLILVISNVSLSSFYFGYMIIYLSVIDFEVVMNIFSIGISHSNAEGFLTFCVPLGGLLGAYASSYFIKNLSRKTTLLYINYLAFILNILIFFADFKFYMAIRVGQGMCAGCFSAIVPLIIKQLAPFELSGFFGVFHQLFITIGIFFCCFFTFLLSLATMDSTGESYWEIIFAFPLLTTALQVISLKTIFSFQTPKYLVEIGDMQQARNLISKLYRQEYVDELLKELESDKKQRNDDKEEVQSESSSQLEKKQLVLPKIISVHLALLQQFVGISAVATYGRAIAEGSLSSFKPILPSIINFQQVVGAALSSFLLTKYGRKTILQVGTLGAAVTNIIIAIGYWVADSNPRLSVVLILTALFYYMANFGLSLGPIVWMYIPEVVKPDFLPYSTMVNWGGSALIILLFPIIKANLPQQNPGPLFFFFSVWSTIAYFVNKKFVIETQGKSEKQIYQQYQTLEGKKE